jgi:hypothetical protein
VSDPLRVVFTLCLARFVRSNLPNPVLRGLHAVALLLFTIFFELIFVLLCLMPFLALCPYCLLHLRAACAGVSTSLEVAWPLHAYGMWWLLSYPHLEVCLVAPGIGLFLLRVDFAGLLSVHSLHTGHGDWLLYLHRYFWLYSWYQAVIEWYTYTATSGSTHDIE